MQAYRTARNSSGKILGICVVLILALAVLMPAASATTMIPQVADEDEEDRTSVPSFRDLNSNQVQFLEYNWYFTIDDLVIDPEPSELGLADPAAVQDQIQFLEDNWYFSASDLVDETEGDDDTPYRWDTYSTEYDW